MVLSLRGPAVLVLGSALLLAACGGNDGSPSGDEANAAADGGTTYKVAQVRWDAGDIFFNGVSAGETAAAETIKTETGDTIEFKTVAENDAAKQLSGLQALIDQGVDGVSLVPWRGESMKNIVSQLLSQGIPVVVHNLTVPGSEAPFVAFDNVEAGRLAGQAMVDAIAEARGDDWATKGGAIVLLRGDVTASFDKDRYTGYMSVLQPIVDANPGVEIVERTDLGYQAEPGRKAVEDAVTRYGADSILAVGSVDGTMAVGGAIPALKTGGAVVGSGKPNAVAVTSIDCSQAELDAISAGQLTHCSEQPALAEGELVTRLLYDMMKNESTTPSEGVEQVAGWENVPFGPVEVTTRKDIAGPWYKTKAFAVPGEVAPDAPDIHWAEASGVTGN